MVNLNLSLYPIGVLNTELSLKISSMSDLSCTFPISSKKFPIVLFLWRQDETTILNEGLGKANDVSIVHVHVL